MSGPCLCGDTACGRCFPGGAQIEAAEEWALDEFAKAGLRPEEYQLAVRVGIEAVKQAREYAKLRIDEEKMIQAEREMDKEGA